MTLDSSLMPLRVTRWAAGAVAALSLLATAEPAAACGGLFCSAANPVNQMAERIIFASDGDGNVICAVQILYEGPSESFSWVLPVPAHSPDEIGVSISSDAAFQRLQQASNPLYQLQTVQGPGCDANRGLFAPQSGFASDSAAGGSGSGESVTVVASGTTGPYDWELIDIADGLADPTDAAITWLGANGYDEPPNGRETLRPYLEDGLGLIAFRLTKSASAGSIRPVILEYPASVPMIPIRPTAVAASDDMGVMVWVLGSSRAVPTNYRSLELNETLIDWFNPGNTYDGVVIAAANEAGGQGFVTEQSGAAGGFAETIWQSWERDQADQLANVTSISALLVDAAQQFGNLDGFVDAVSRTVTLRAPVTPEQFVSCPWCYYEDVGIDPYQTVQDPALDPSLGADPAAFLAAFEEFVIAPMEATRKLFEDYAHVTRMYTTLSADEMTLDPEFDFNAELEDVDNLHVAEQTLSCLGGDGPSSWTVKLPSGYSVSGSGTDWPTAVGDMPANLRVVQLATTGPGEVIADNREAIREQLSRDSSGCGCRVATAPRGGSLGVVAALGLLGVMVARRRR